MLVGSTTSFIEKTKLGIKEGADSGIVGISSAQFI